MGYEKKRLVNEIDDEFLCSICTMVPENPMVSPCDHIFCRDCVEKWLEVKTTCPVDSRWLALDDIKPAPRYVRNMLDKVKIKCNFESEGCQTIVPLEQLQHHFTECVFNPNAEIICEKGCNMKITRDEFVAANCFEHLANRLQEHFDKITTRQEEKIEKLSNEVDRQRQEMIGVRCQAHSKLLEEVGQLREDLRKLTVEGNIQREENDKTGVQRNATFTRRIFKNTKTSIGQPQILECDKKESTGFRSVLKLENLQDQEEQIVNINSTLRKLSEKLEILDSPRWQMCYNMHIDICEPNILEYGKFNERKGLALVQSLHSMAPDNSYFKIQILDVGIKNIVTIGLTSKGFPIKKHPGWLEGSIGYHGDNGKLYNESGEGEEFGPKWKNGDIIECGIEFPVKFVNNGNTRVEVYFSRNEQLVGKRTVKMPAEGFFPTVAIQNPRGKVKYLSR